MSEVLTVPTAFGDISDLTEGLVDRVDGEQIILYGPNPYDEGAELDFSVLLLDGTPALEGRGRVEASVDGGEDRDPSTRFDIIVGALELEGVAEAVFERMLMARSSMLAAEGSGEEAPAEEAYAEEAHAEEAPAEEPVAEDEAAEVAPAEEAPAEDADEAPAEEAEEAPVEEPAAEAAYAEDDAAAEEVAVDAPEAAEEVAVDAPADEWGGDDDAFNDEATVVDDTIGFMEREAQAEAEAAAAAAEEGEADAEAAEVAPSVSPAIAIPTELFPADDAFRGAAPPAAPEDPGGFGVSNDLTEGLVRPVQQNTWTPVAPERPDPRPSSGLFQYGASIPLPNAPPRPDLDPSLVVARAPHPSGAAPVAAVAYAAEASVAYEEDVADEAEYVEDDVEAGYEAAAAEELDEEAAVEAEEYELEESE
jgi:hypothetical protein